MIPPEDAAKAATAYARNLVGADELKNVRVEEVEPSGDGREWLITLGWVEKASRTIGASALPFGAAAGAIEPLPRVYRVFRVDAESGDVKSMKMRD